MNELTLSSDLGVKWHSEVQAICCITCFHNLEWKSNEIYFCYNLLCSDKADNCSKFKVKVNMSYAIKSKGQGQLELCCESQNVMVNMRYAINVKRSRVEVNIYELQL